MIPNRSIIHAKENSVKYLETKSNYETFVSTIASILLRRKNTILSKQANIFTTNIDVFLETALENLKIEYNDGFSGRLNPTFGIANFKKSVQQRSLHFDHISEIPVINIIKIHGSLTWIYESEKSDKEIIFSSNLRHINKSLLKKSGTEFLEGYRRILVVNPEESKHLESVLNVYYSELLRLYSSELEKENAVLFVMGFSMEDRHIKEITLRAAKSNPTLRIYVFCYKFEDKENMEEKLKVRQHPNIQIVAPENIDNEKRLGLSRITETIFKDIWNNNIPQNTLNKTEVSSNDNIGEDDKA